jgi:hypothetical protein
LDLAKVRTDVFASRTVRAGEIFADSIKRHNFLCKNAKSGLSFINYAKDRSGVG